MQVLTDAAAAILAELYLVLHGYKQPDLVCLGMIGCLSVPLGISGFVWWLRQHDQATRARIKIEMMDEMVARKMIVNNVGTTAASIGGVIAVVVLIVIGLLVLFLAR